MRVVVPKVASVSGSESAVRTAYRWYCSTSTTVPDLSHFVGWRPVCFWIMTASSQRRGDKP